MWRWKAGVLQTSRQGGREAELYICKIFIWSIEISVSNIMCGSKFELKLNDVRFVGHPVLLELDIPMRVIRKTTITMFHVMFALMAVGNYSIVACYHGLRYRLC